jgi:CBS domain-containing protein
MGIQNILDRNRAEVIKMCLTDTIKSTADRMRAHNIAAPVVKGGAAIAGLLSDARSYMPVSRHGEGALHVTVVEIVTRPTITIAPDDTLKGVMSLMTHHRVRHLPVIAQRQARQHRQHRRCRQTPAGRSGN